MPILIPDTLAPAGAFHLIDRENVRGGLRVVDTHNDRVYLPPGEVIDGSVVVVREDQSVWIFLAGTGWLRFLTHLQNPDGSVRPHVMTSQARESLTADGVVGPQTVQAMSTIQESEPRTAWDLLLDD